MAEDQTPKPPVDGTPPPPKKRRRRRRRKPAGAKAALGVQGTPVAGQKNGSTSKRQTPPRVSQPVIQKVESSNVESSSVELPKVESSNVEPSVVPDVPEKVEVASELPAVSYTALPQSYYSSEPEVEPTTPVEVAEPEVTLPEPVAEAAIAPSVEPAVESSPVPPSAEPISPEPLPPELPSVENLSPEPLPPELPSDLPSAEPDFSQPEPSVGSEEEAAEPESEPEPATLEAEIVEQPAPSLPEAQVSFAEPDFTQSPPAASTFSPFDTDFPAAPIRASVSRESSEETPPVVTHPPEKASVEVLEEKSAGKPFTDVLKAFKPVFGFIGEHVKLSHIFLVVGAIILAALLYAGYAFNIYQSAYKYAVDFFTPKTPPVVEVHVDENFLSQSGIITALLMADNTGARFDHLNATMWDSFFFGELAEPKAEGEVGLTPVYYYGTSQDVVDKSNLFILYVEDLQNLENLYRVDVYAMLDSVTDREKKLSEYSEQLKATSKKSEENMAALQTEIDNLKISYNSLNPDRANFEKDFFAALDRLGGEKADFLLKSYVDVSQKQVALKAHLAGLQKLLTYYVNAIKLFKLRIEAIDKNHAALIQGIRVIDVPGSNIDFIIKQGT